MHHLNKFIKITFAFLAHFFYARHILLLNEKLLYAEKEFNAEKYARLKIVIDVLVSAEDHRFKYHPGFDVIAMVRAFKQRIIYMKHEGASTIDQQLVRVLTGDYRNSFSRKIKEIFLATTLTEKISRRNIPVLYLNIVFLGSGIVGINQYLAKRKITLEHVDLTIAAEIVARIKYPEPLKYSKRKTSKINNRVAHVKTLYLKHQQSFFKFHNF